MAVLVIVRRRLIWACSAGHFREHFVARVSVRASWSCHRPHGRQPCTVCRHSVTAREWGCPGWDIKRPSATATIPASMTGMRSPRGDEGVPVSRSGCSRARGHLAIHDASTVAWGTLFPGARASCPRGRLRAFGPLRAGRPAPAHPAMAFGSARNRASGLVVDSATC